MDPKTKAKIVEEGGKIASDAIKLFLSHPRKKVAEVGESTRTTATEAITAKLESPKVSAIPRPTSEETTLELKRRLYQEIYKAELDLAQGLVIASKPCQCLEAKHTWMIEAVAKELIPEDPNNTVYPDIIQWIKTNQPKVITEAIQSGKYKQEYPQMSAQFRGFRKRIMSDEDWEKAKQQAKKEAEGFVVTETINLTHDHTLRQPVRPITPAVTPAPEVITLEQAKAMAAEKATTEVERAWHSVEKK